MTNKEIYQLLVSGGEAAGIVDDWVASNEACNLRLRRAKTKGCVVIETDEPIFASRIKIWHPACKVHIKKI